jgi:hypothetical protein
VIHAAVDYSGTDEVSFNVDERLIGSSVSGNRNGRKRVPVVRLSNIQQELRSRRFALVCDIEGAEADLFENESDALKSCAQIIIELHPTNKYSISDLQRLIESSGFSLSAKRRNVFVYDRVPSDRQAMTGVDS